MNSTEQNKKVSIIVPVYNVEKYLSDCINSLINQTYLNLEILLINDGSKDNSLKILNSFAEKDSRITVFDKHNHGVSYTRNFGIHNCTGDYIAFVDSDDIVAENYIKTLVELIEHEGADMSICSYTCFDKERPVFSSSGSNKSFKENLETVFFTTTRGMPWGKLFKSNIIKQNRIFFDESIFVCEDLLFNMQYVAYCENLVFNASKYYGYLQREGSAVRDTVSPKWFTVLKTYRFLFDNYADNSVYPYVVYNYLKFLYEAKYIIKNRGVKPDFDIDIKSEIKKAEKKKGILSFKNKARLFICKHLFFIVEKRR